MTGCGLLGVRLLSRGAVGGGGGFLNVLTNDTLNYAFFGDSFSSASTYGKAIAGGFIGGLLFGAVRRSSPGHR
jgi:hypothetical protein